MDPAAGFGTKAWHKLLIIVIPLTTVSFRELFAVLDERFDSLLNNEALGGSSNEV